MASLSFENTRARGLNGDLLVTGVLEYFLTSDPSHPFSPILTLGTRVLDCAETVMGGLGITVHQHHAVKSKDRGFRDENWHMTISDILFFFPTPALFLHTNTHTHTQEQDVQGIYLFTYLFILLYTFMLHIFPSWLWGPEIRVKTVKKNPQTWLKRAFQAKLEAELQCVCVLLPQNRIKLTKVIELPSPASCRWNEDITADGEGLWGGSPTPTRGINAHKWRRSQTFDIPFQMGEGQRPLWGRL